MLDAITRMSNRYGADRDYVLAGGGNTSCKDENFLYVKPSGVSLAAIKPGNFVKMERKAIRRIFEMAEISDRDTREAVVKKVMADAVAFDSAGRPSVEAPLHELLDFRFVVHLHPSLVNGLMCAKDSQAETARLFPGSLYVAFCDPGYKLATVVGKAVMDYRKANGKVPHLVFLENHGVFVAADSEAEIDALYADIMGKLKAAYAAKDVAAELAAGELDADFACEHAPELRSLLAEDGKPVTVVTLAPFTVAAGPLTPDHVVYAKSFALVADAVTPEAVEAFRKQHGYLPKVVSVPGKAVFCTGATLKDAQTVAELAKDAGRVQQLTAVFGGARFMSDDARLFIENWEVESYRKKVAQSGGSGSLNGKIAIVTGGAQGFGYGIARELIAAGAVAVIADLNLAGAEKAAAELNAEFGAWRALAAAVNIADEASVAAMVRGIVLAAGGMDILVANAGVLKAGSVKDMEKKDWDFVTNVNYSGYFLCVKHISQVMARQNRYGSGWLDIVQVNSKSGLAGSNRNGAYAGSKFGTIGLTQSFALELVTDRIKVNSVCPGNFFDGPLWSDPERGLFVQYLNSGKVPGAKTVADVKAFYEAKIPMNRGCFPADVARAIIYAVEQCYETGQAIPVTGGQVMLN